MLLNHFGVFSETKTQCFNLFPHYLKGSSI